MDGKGTQGASLIERWEQFGLKWTYGDKMTQDLTKALKN